MLPFYGDVDLMKQTVMSVKSQSSPEWLLTVVDDGYPDMSISGWFEALNDSRIRYFRNEVNLGANGNYRRSVELIDHEWCMIMGADDLLETSYVAKMLDVISAYPKATMIHPGVSVIDESNDFIDTSTDKTKTRISLGGSNVSVVEGENLAKSLMHGNWMYFPAITWRSEEIKRAGFRPGLDVCQDLGLAADLIMNGAQMVITPEKLFRYRRHSASDSSVRALSGERFEEESEFFKALANEFKQIGWNKAAFAARLHLTSRLHAIYLMPKSIKSKTGFSKLLKHAFL